MPYYLKVLLNILFSICAAKTNCYHIWYMYRTYKQASNMKRGFSCRRRLLCKACKWKIQIILNKIQTKERNEMFTVSATLFNFHHGSNVCLNAQWIFLCIRIIFCFRFFQRLYLLIHFNDLRRDFVLLAENLFSQGLQLLSLLVKCGLLVKWLFLVTPYHKPV